MYLNKTERQELSTLSKEAFGRTNYWQKLLNNGAVQLATTFQINKGTVTIDPVPVGRKGRHIKHTVTKWFNDINDLKTYMNDIITKKQALLEEIKAAQKQGIPTEAK